MNRHLEAFLEMLVAERGAARNTLAAYQADLADFAAFSRAQGNDLSTPMPQYGFAGLKPGDRWCLCAPRWQEAFEAGQAPGVVLEATHEGALRYCALADLKRHAA